MDSQTHGEQPPVRSVAEYNERYPPLPGFRREWRRCRTCSRVFSYDYQPYSFANPVRWTPCGHSVGHRDLNVDPVDEAAADEYFRQQAEGDWAEAWATAVRGGE